MEDSKKPSDVQITTLTYLNPSVLWQRQPKEMRLAFLSTLIIGFITHLFAFSNVLLNHDAATSISTKNSHLDLGRWSLELFSSFSWVYQMPVVICFLSILALAISAALTIRFLKIHSPTCIVLASAFMVVFPVIPCTFSFLYTADAYFFAALLNISAACLAKGRYICWPFSILCIAVSAGIYQSYVACVVGLLLFDCILALLDHIPVKEVFMRGIRYILIILMGLILYWVILQAVLRINGMTVMPALQANYRGGTTALNNGVMGHLLAIPEAFRTFMRFLWSPSYLTSMFKLLQRVMFFLATCSALFLLVVRRIYKEPIRLLLLICGAFMLPVALNIFQVILSGTYMDMLMQYSYVFAFVFAIKCFEMTAEEIFPSWETHRFPKYLQHGMTLVSLLLCAVLVWSNICLCNLCYLGLFETYEESYAVGIRLIDRLETTEGYVPGVTPILFAGNYCPMLTGYPWIQEMRGINESILNSYSGPMYLYWYLGMNWKWINWDFLDPSYADKRAEIESSGILETIPAFPHKDCIQWYDDIIIIKL